MPPYVFGFSKKRKLSASGGRAGTMSLYKASRSSLAKSRIPRPLQVHSFVRKFQISNINLGTAGALITGGISTKLSQLPNASEFQNLFDAYRIDLVTVRFDWTRNTADLSGASVVGAPIMYNVIDKDDENPPANVNTCLEYQTCRLHNFADRSTFSRSYIPAIAKTVFNTALTSGYGREQRAWLDVASPDIPHYGMKYAVSASTSNVNAGEIIVTVTLKFSCRDTR